VFHDGADDTAYRDLLRGATALVTASRDEGFGLPLVEAMGVGTPLVVSDIPVFREVGGDAATYVDADDVAGFVRAIRALADDATFAAASAAARQRATLYSWERSARVLLALAERVVDVRRRAAA
jgi:glycosyltransferase involved in cell wall biosynthesis